MALSISSFLLIQNKDTDFKDVFLSPSISKFVCLWSDAGCGMYGTAPKESNKTYSRPYDFYAPFSFINKLNPKIVSIPSYVLLGIGSIDSYGKEWIYNGYFWNEYNYYEINNKINFVHIILTLLVICAFVFLKEKRKELLFLLIIMSLFLLVYYPFGNLKFNFFIEAFTLGLIPIAGAGMVITTKRLSKGIMSKILIIIGTLILISPFFTEDIYERMRVDKDLTENWERLNSIIEKGDLKNCGNFSEKFLRKECIDWIKINAALEEERGCDSIKNNNLKLKCLPRETDLNLLREQFTLSKRKIINISAEVDKDNILSRLKHHNLHNEGMEECFDKEVFRFLCSGMNDIPEIFYGKQEQGYIKRTYCPNVTISDKDCLENSAIYDYITHNDRLECTNFGILPRCARIYEINMLIEDRYNKKVFDCMFHHFYFEYKCMLSKMIRNT